MTEPRLPECDATKVNKARCAVGAPYRCSNGHHVCVQHSFRLGGQRRRRQTDRKCAICVNLGITAKVEWLAAPEVLNERRSEKLELREA